MWRDWLMHSAPWLLVGVALGVPLGNRMRARSARDRDASNDPRRGNFGDRLLVLDQIRLGITVNGQISDVAVGVSGITAEYVERWLDERNLVMAPKALDWHRAPSTR